MKNRVSTCLVVMAIMSHTLPLQATINTVFTKILSVGGVDLITLRGSSTESVRVRSEVIEDRLVSILSDPDLAAGDVQIRHINTDYSIYVKNQPLITVTPQDSAYNQNSQEKQAQIWQEILAKKLPLVKVTSYQK